MVWGSGVILELNLSLKGHIPKFETVLHTESMCTYINFRYKGEHVLGLEVNIWRCDNGVRGHLRTEFITTCNSLRDISSVETVLEYLLLKQSKKEIGVLIQWNTEDDNQNSLIKWDFIDTEVFINGNFTTQLSSIYI